MHTSSGVTRVGTPGAATEGVTPLFFPEKTWRLFCSSLSLSLSLFIAFTRVPGVTPFRVSPHTFFTCPTSFLHYFCKFACNFFPSGVTPWRVSPGAVRPPSLLVTPLHTSRRRLSGYIEDMQMSEVLLLIRADENTCDICTR